MLKSTTGPAALYESEGWKRLGATSLDLGGFGYGDVPPLQLWVYLSPRRADERRGGSDRAVAARSSPFSGSEPEPRRQCFLMPFASFRSRCTAAYADLGW